MVLDLLHMRTLFRNRYTSFGLLVRVLIPVLLCVRCTDRQAWCSRGFKNVADTGAAWVRSKAPAVRWQLPGGHTRRTQDPGKQAVGDKWLLLCGDPDPVLVILPVF